LITRGDNLSGAVGDSTVLDDSLDQPVTIAAASGSRIDTLWAQVIVPVLANATVIVPVRNRATAFVAVDAEHAVGGIVGDDGELMLIGIHLEAAVARLTDGQLLLGMRNLSRVDERDSWESLGRSSRAQDSLKVTVTRLVELHRGFRRWCR
jgi:hypothetical protein